MKKLKKTLASLLIPAALLFSTSKAKSNEITLFQENFETRAIDSEYSNWDDSRPGSPFYSHIRDSENAYSELGDKVLQLGNFGGFIEFPTQTEILKINYDFYVSTPDPAFFGFNYTHGHFANQVLNRIDTWPHQGPSDFSVYHGYLPRDGTENGFYLRSPEDVAGTQPKYLITPGGWDQWFHIERILDIPNQMETVKLTNRRNSEEMIFQHEFINNYYGLNWTNFGGVAGSYALIDNIKITSIPEPSTLALLGLGALALKKRKV